MVFVLIGISAHPVWIGLIFAYIFGFKLGWYADPGYCDVINPSTDCGGPVQWACHMILPWITFAILFAALYVRMIRANVIEAMNEDYVRTARAKGAPEWRVMRSHVLRNALLPVVTMLGMDIGARARRGDLHRDDLRPARARQDCDHGRSGLRPARSMHGRGRVRDLAIIIVQPARRPLYTPGSIRGSGSASRDDERS